MSDMNEHVGPPMVDETTLVELDERFHLSKRAWNLCILYGLHTLGQLRAQANRPKGFYLLAGCGKATVLELEDLLAKVAGTQGEREAPMVPNHVPGTDPVVEGQVVDAHCPAFDLDLPPIASTFGLSVRAFNVLETANLTSLSAIQEFRLLHGDFRKLRNCGSTTQLELDVLLEKAAAMGLGRGSLGAPPVVPVDMADLDRFFAILVAGLTQRTRNVLEAMIGPLSAASAIAYFKRHGSRWSGQPGVGVVARRELRDFRRRLLEAVDGNAFVTIHAPGADTTTGLSRWYLRHRIPIEVRGALFNEHGRMTVLRFLEHYLDLTGTDSKTRVRSAYLKQGAVPHSLEDLAQRTELTRERVRQLLVHMDREFLASIALIADLPDVEGQYPELTQTGPLFVVTTELASRLNLAEGTRWSPLFIVYVALVLNGAKHQRMEWTDLFDRSADSKALDISAPLMMDRTLADHISPVTRMVAEQILQRRARPMVMELDSALAHLPGEQRNQVKEVVHRLIAVRFPELIIAGDTVTFPPNTRKKQVDLLEEVLASLNEPSHVSQVVEEWSRMFPDEPITEEGVRSVAVREKDRFFSIGRTSTYGLRSWEFQREDVRGGTIRDIAVSILSGTSDPMHVDDLTKLIQRFRPDTNAYSLKTNLQLDQGKRFVLFPGGYAGLAGKLYEHIPIPRSRIPGSLLRRTVLRSFIGRSLDSLVAYIHANSEVSADRVRAMVERKVADGTLVVDSERILLAVVEPHGEAEI